MTTRASRDQVWRVLSDGWLYPLWVVGATRMRDVDGHWPEPGARLHHSAGVWPAVTDDTTEVLESQPRESLVLRARGWPAGEAEVVVTLADEGEGTRIDLEEDAVRGPGRLMPALARRPLIHVRNRESLRRLVLLAEGRAR
ncbi:SRPBCC family protein [Nocardioides aestuarii]|uniref:SRPBCC family protein n=1 Tax=Nocardioides aestuarii TaxID=252231 RepID=A0ABW4TVI7_9ACTN